MKRNLKRICAFMLTLALVLSLNGLSDVTIASAASKAPKLSAKKVVLNVKKSKVVKLKNKPKATKVAWSVQNKKIAKVKNGKITGLKAGKTKVICKITYTKKVKGKKKAAKKLTVTVEVKAAKKAVKATVAPVPTKAPAATATVAPAQTTAPAADTAAPAQTTEPTDDSNLLAEAKENSHGFKTRDNGQMRNLDTKTLMKKMGLGWNYGNSLEGSLMPNKVTEDTTVSDYETSWGNKAITQENMDQISKYGFRNVRIPVAWSNMISNDGKYTINEKYLDRVEEVMNYALNNGMYVIVNVHYDSGWWGQFGLDDYRDQAWARFESYWKQIAERYKDYSDRLIFESANEELGDRLNDAIYPSTGTAKTADQSETKVQGKLSAAKCYDLMNQINQKFVDIVRATGGNNATRHLLIAGYNTDIDKTCDAKFVMPKDTDENGNSKLSVSVHYYTPWSYCGGTEGGTANTWGTAREVKKMHDNIDKMKKFTEQGYGVIYGEFGVQAVSVDGINKFISEFSTYSMENGMCPVLWDNGAWFNRSTNYIAFDDIAATIQSITGSTAVFPEQGNVTGIPVFETAEESALDLKYTWNGKWTKNDGSNTAQFYEQTSCDDGLRVYCNNDWYYWATLHFDWNSMKQPYIRITTDQSSDDAIATAKQTTVTFGTGKLPEGGSVDNDADCENSTKNAICSYGSSTNWPGQCVKLKKDMLSNTDLLYLTFDKGVTITKIEIFDEK